MRIELSAQGTTCAVGTLRPRCSKRLLDRTDCCASTGAPAFMQSFRGGVYWYLRQERQAACQPKWCADRLTTSGPSAATVFVLCLVVEFYALGVDAHFPWCPRWLQDAHAASPGPGLHLSVPVCQHPTPTLATLHSHKIGKNFRRAETLTYTLRNRRHLDSEHARRRALCGRDYPQR